MSPPTKKARGATDDELAGPAPARTRCVEKTVRGKRCKNKAVIGADRCVSHLGRVGRPPKLTDELVEKIVAVLAVGGYPEVAAATVGISRSTFYAWLERGDPEAAKQDDEPYREFRRRIDQVRAEAEAASVERIRAAGMKDWKAHAWLLEREFPDRWAGPRGRGIRSSIHPDDFAAGETSSSQDVVDDQIGPDGRPL